MSVTGTALSVPLTLLGHAVVVTFSDGGHETGLLTHADGSQIEVDRYCKVGGDPAGCHWTASYTLKGDADTPHVVAVALRPVQDEKLF